MEGELNYAPPIKREDRPEYSAKREELRAAGVKYVFSAYTDLHGVGKGKMVPIDHFNDMMRGSELFTGAAIDGLGQTPADDEISPWPDLDRIMIMPHRPEVAVAFGHLHYGGEPWPMCSPCASVPALPMALRWISVKATTRASWSMRCTKQGACRPAARSLAWCSMRAPTRTPAWRCMTRSKGRA